MTDPKRALCGKNEEVALEAKLKGNDCFSKGEYSNAVRFYSQVCVHSSVDLLSWILYLWGSTSVVLVYCIAPVYVLIY